MTREELQMFILKQYGIMADFPWADEPDFAVLRHAENKKWFALVMAVPKEKLGLPGGGNLLVVNLKCDPLLIGTLLRDEGIFPAYHMNKTHWITVALDGSAADETIKMLVDLSFSLTAPRKKSGKQKLGHKGKNTARGIKKK